jgi:hypothetical protein
MGKASRRKRKGATKTHKQPDEAFECGPLRIERFGRFLRYRNESTPEQHAEFLKRVSRSHDAIKGDLEKQVRGALTSRSWWSIMTQLK